MLNKDLRVIGEDEEKQVIVFIAPNYKLGVRFESLDLTVQGERALSKGRLERLLKATEFKTLWRETYQALKGEYYKNMKLNDIYLSLTEVEEVEVKIMKGKPKPKVYKATKPRTLNSFGIYGLNIKDKVTKLQYAIFSDVEVAKKSIKKGQIGKSFIFGIFSRIKQFKIDELTDFLFDVTELLINRSVNLLVLELGQLDLSRLARNNASASALLMWFQRSRELGLTIRFDGITEPIATMSLLLGGLAQTGMRKNQLAKKYNTCKNKLSNKLKTNREGTF